MTSKTKQICISSKKTVDKFNNLSFWLKITFLRNIKNICFILMICCCYFLYKWNPQIIFLNLKYFLWSKKTNICLKLFLPLICLTNRRYLIPVSLKFPSNVRVRTHKQTHTQTHTHKLTHTHTHNRMNHLQWVEPTIGCFVNQTEQGRRIWTDQKCKIPHWNSKWQQATIRACPATAPLLNSNPIIWKVCFLFVE